jgi:hypothetical protein
MPTRGFEQMALAQLLGAFVFSACVLIDHAQAQPGYVPPPTPLPPPVFNPYSPNVVPQRRYRSITPSTPTTVPNSEVTPSANEELSRTVHHHHHRGYYTGAGPSLGSFDCSYGWCVRISPPYAYYRPYAWYRY